MTSPVTTRRPDALDLSEICEIAGKELLRCADEFERDGLDLRSDQAEALSAARYTANRVLAALDAYEART